METKITIGVQVNGKVRGEIEITFDTSEEDAVAEARKLENVMKHLVEGDIFKIIYVPGKILGFVVK